MLQLIMAGAIAVVIVAVILYFFNNMGKLKKQPAAKGGEKPVTRTQPKQWPAQEPVLQPKVPALPQLSKPVVKEKLPKPSKKSEDLSQDYIYGLVTGKMESEAERPLAKHEYDYWKKV